MVHFYDLHQSSHSVLETRPGEPRTGFRPGSNLVPRSAGSHESESPPRLALPSLVRSGTRFSRGLAVASEGWTSNGPPFGQPETPDAPLMLEETARLAAVSLVDQVADVCDPRTPIASG